MSDPDYSLRQAFVTVAIVVAGLWVITIVNSSLDLGLQRFGVYPRRVESLAGILFAPMIHGSIKHLFSNSLPLLVLGTALLYGYPRAGKVALPIIYIGSGMAVWIMGRASFHIGASGIVLGILVFVFAMGIVRWEPKSIALSCLVFFIYGGLIWGIVSVESGISFEYHLFGAIMGASCVWFFKNLDPPPPRKRYDWEDEDY